MKMKLFTVFSFVCLSVLNAVGQSVPKMDLRSSGFVGPDSINHFVVIEFPKVSQADLYKKTLAYVNSLYNNPQAVVSAVASENITIRATTDQIKGKAPQVYYPTNYNIVIDFKDGKIRFTPTIVRIRENWTGVAASDPFYISNKDSNNPRELKAVWIVRDSGPMLFHPEVKASLDNWVNSFIAGIAAKVNEKW